MSLTLDSNVFVAAIKEDEPFSEECREVLRVADEMYMLHEPSVVFAEVLGTLGRRVGLDVAESAGEKLDRMFGSGLYVCDRAFCLRAYPLCERYGIYSVDALYLEAAIESGATLVSLDRRDFVDRVKGNDPPVRVLHVSEFLE
jgi:predicted nucleic acid-binding protein